MATWLIVLLGAAGGVWIAGAAFLALLANPFSDGVSAWENLWTAALWPVWMVADGVRWCLPEARRRRARHEAMARELARQFTQAAERAQREAMADVYKPPVLLAIGDTDRAIRRRDMARCCHCAKRGD